VHFSTNIALIRYEDMILGIDIICMQQKKKGRLLEIAYVFHRKLLLK